MSSANSRNAIYHTSLSSSHFDRLPVILGLGSSVDIGSFDGYVKKVQFDCLVNLVNLMTNDYTVKYAAAV